MTSDEELVKRFQKSDAHRYGNIRPWISSPPFTYSVIVQAYAAKMSAHTRECLFRLIDENKERHLSPK